MTEIKQPGSVEEALDQADLSDLEDVLIIGTRSDGRFFMRAYGLNKAEAMHQAEVAKMFMLGILANAEDDDGEGEQE